MTPGAPALLGFDLVLHVLSLCTHQQMTGIDTTCRITCMTDHQTIRYRSLVLQEHVPMCFVVLVLILDDSVTGSILAPGKDPTALLIYFVF